MKGFLRGVDVGKFSCGVEEDRFEGSVACVGDNANCFKAVWSLEVAEGVCGRFWIKDYHACCGGGNAAGFLFTFPFVCEVESTE